MKVSCEARRYLFYWNNGFEHRFIAASGATLHKQIRYGICPRPQYATRESCVQHTQANLRSVRVLGQMKCEGLGVKERFA